MTTKVAKLQRASLRDPVKVQVNDKYKTVDTLCQTYLFVPFKYRDVHLVFVLNEHAGKSTIVFCSKRLAALRVCYMLRNLGSNAWALFGTGVTIDKVETSTGDAFEVFDRRIARADGQGEKQLLDFNFTQNSSEKPFSA